MTDEQKKELERLRSDHRLVRLTCDYVTLHRMAWCDGYREFAGLDEFFPMHEGATLTIKYEPNKVIPKQNP
jgi:hypothetical protein